MFQLKSDKKNYGISFPTTVEEITPDILDEVTKKVKLPNNYCIVMLAFKTRLFDFVVAMNSNKETSVSVVPVMAKISDEDAKLVNVCVGDRIIVDRTNLERGVHLHLPIMISTANAKNYISSDQDLSKAIVMNKLGNDIKKQDIVVVEFKILPINDISASISSENTAIDPFLYKVTDVN